MTINYNNLPLHMQDGARLYVEHGVPPGPFLTALICDDLYEAFGRADDINESRIQDWARFFHNDAPSTCWGSPAKMAAWIAQGGMNAVAA